MLARGIVHAEGCVCPMGEFCHPARLLTLLILNASEISVLIQATSMFF